MKKLSLLVGLAAVAIAVAVAPAGAVKLPTYYVYQKCNKKKTSCLGAGYVQGSKLVSMSLSPKCTKTSFLQISSGNPVKISSSGKFSFTAQVSTYNTGDTESVTGTATVKGKVKSKKKITGTWKVDKVASSCSKVDHGSYKFKYTGVAHGG
jgi:hypothetical protein